MIGFISTVVAVMLTAFVLCTLGHSMIVVVFLFLGSSAFFFCRTGYFLSCAKKKKCFWAHGTLGVLTLSSALLYTFFNSHEYVSSGTNAMFYILVFSSLALFSVCGHQWTTSKATSILAHIAGLSVLCIALLACGISILS